ncbi:MAG: restriction endonuclease subunit S [Actinobacteria bacterium]|nr:restriction endonuclease subunit S [Actinomycetota bacterium]
MTEWPTSSVAELQSAGVLLVEDGNHGEYRPRPHEFLDDGTPFIRAADISDGRIDLSRTGGIGDVALRRVRKGIGRPGDILFSHKGTVGKLARVPLDAPAFVCSPQTTFWRVLDDSHLDRDYLYAFMRSRAFIDQWWARKGETDMADYVSLTAQRQLRVTVPPLPVQRLIAEPLAALDDLIENNRRRIELLEQMAESIYRGWFVHFHFPGYEDTTYADSPLGPIPRGWEVKPLNEIATIIQGRSYRKHELVEVGGLPFINLKCMRRGGGFRHDGLKRYDGSHNSEQCVAAGDIVLAVTDLTQGREILARATLVPRLGEDFGIISLDVVRVVANDPDDRLAVFFSLRCTDFADRVKEYANGSTVLHLSPNHVAQGLVLWPAGGLRRRFVEIVDPMVSQIEELSDAVDRLAVIRDLLLPKLVTGEIDVSDLDLDAVGESVA